MYAMGSTLPSKRKPPAHHARISALERELRQTLEQYELVFKATHDVLYDLDIQTGTVSWNEALSDQFNYPSDELSNSLEWWVSHIHPDDALDVEQKLYTWFASDRSTWQTEYRFRKADGSYSDVLDRGFVTRAADGTPQRIIGSLLDITPQKELERAKDEFISLVSHQLRTPLTVIRVYGEMFADGLLGKLTKVQARHISRMTDASVRLIRLVNEILDVSRVEMGHYTVMQQPTDLNQLIEECIRQLKPLAVEKRVTIDFTPDSNCKLMHIDSTVLAQIVDNLLANAVRYTLPDKGQVSVSCQRGPGHVTIRVKDNGIGIPKDAEERIFDRFYRAHNAVNIEEHGTGLGLYLVRILTTTLGGAVWFESSRKQGTTFYVSVPVE